MSEEAAAAVAKRRREKSVEKEIWMHTHLMSWGKWWDETRRVSEWERERKKNKRSDYKYKVN